MHSKSEYLVSPHHHQIKNVLPENASKQYVGHEWKKKKKHLFTEGQLLQWAPLSFLRWSYNRVRMSRRRARAPDEQTCRLKARLARYYLPANFGQTYSFTRGKPMVADQTEKMRKTSCLQIHAWREGVKVRKIWIYKTDSIRNTDLKTAEENEDNESINYPLANQRSLYEF